MNRQEHNRSWEGTSMSVPQNKNDICDRTKITPQGIYLRYAGLVNLKKHQVHKKLQW